MAYLWERMVKLFRGKIIEVLVGTTDNPYSKLMKSSFLLILPLFLLIYSSIFAVDTGSDAPSFSLLDQNGEKLHSSDFLNKKNILIFFYPAAMTGGCTKQACSYRDDIAEWQSRDFEIIGISGDKPENLKLVFTQWCLMSAYHLPFPHLTNHSAAQNLREMFSRNHQFPDRPQ